MTGRWLLPAAIVLAAVMICATLLVLNLRVTYPVPDLNGQTITRLIEHGCTAVPFGISGNNATVAISCPVWLRP
jgi:hypothetical protein